MNAILKYIDLHCGECGELLHKGHSVIRCMNKHCSNYMIRYKYPRLTLWLDEEKETLKESVKRRRRQSIESVVRNQAL